MQVYTVPYTTLRQEKVIKSLQFYHVPQLVGYIVLAIASTFGLRAEIVSEEEIADFTNNCIGFSREVPAESVAEALASLPIPQIVTTKPRNGNRAYDFSVDFTKRETWYHDSVKVTDEVVGTGDGILSIFQLAHGNASVLDEAIVDLCHGKITDEHLIVAADGGNFVPIIKVDGVPQVQREPYEVSGGDYSLNFTTGLLTFHSIPALASVITATYYYVPASAGPKIVLRPPPGKKWTIDIAEAQFTSDVVLTDTLIENIFITAYNVPVPWYPPTRLFNFGNILDYTVGSFPVIPAFGGAERGSLHDTYVLRWDYQAPIILRYSDGVDLRVWTEHKRGYTGERATIAFYAFEDDDL